MIEDKLSRDILARITTLQIQTQCLLAAVSVLFAYAEPGVAKVAARAVRERGTSCSDSLEKQLGVAGLAVPVAEQIAAMLDPPAESGRPN